jgi:hypothetical protein
LRRTIAALYHHIESSDLIDTAHPGTFKPYIFPPAWREDVESIDPKRDEQNTARQRKARAQDL